MSNDDFDFLLGLVDRLEVGQRERLKAALEAGDEEAAVIELVEKRLGDVRACPHCRRPEVVAWGRSHGLKRYRCKSCARTFNALTGTPLARLRKKACWLRFAACLSERATVRDAARHCAVAVTTSFRWRHRFLRAELARSDELSGIVEADETFLRLSFKGSRAWRDGRNPPPRPPKKRATPAQKRGLSDEQVPVLVARDRSGATRAYVLPDRSKTAIDAAIGEALPKDGILCSDTWRAFGAMAGERGVRHEPVNLCAGERVRDGTWHIQNANSHHNRLKSWITGFRGVATRYLANYLGWHHVVDQGLDRSGHAEWLRLAINS